MLPKGLSLITRQPFLFLCLRTTYKDTLTFPISLRKQYEYRKQLQASDKH